MTMIYPICRGIMRWCDEKYMCPVCGYDDTPKPTIITNADRIRSMTDEELADKFEEVQLNTVKAYGNDDMLLAGELRKYWLDWLKEEAKT